MLRCLPLWLLLLVVTGCSDEQRTKLPPVAGGPVISEGKAGVIVTNYLTKKATALSLLEPPHSSYDFASAEWRFSFRLKVPTAPGADRFWIIVDKSGNATYVGDK